MKDRREFERRLNCRAGEHSMTRRVFISEFVTGGAGLELSPDNSLAREGRAMLWAVVRDFLAMPTIEVLTTWDRRLGQFPIFDLGLDDEQLPRFHVFEVDSWDEELPAFLTCCESATDVLVIAPEFHGILVERRRLFDSFDCANRVNWLGCDLAALALCADKLKLAQHLERHDIATVPTQSLDIGGGGGGDNISAKSDFPVIVKPRDGAGSTATWRLDSPAEHARLLSDGLPSDFEFIQQPFVAGQLVSCAAIIDHGRLSMVLPPGKQVVSSDGRFTYLGMDLEPDFAAKWDLPATALIQQCCEAIPGLNGYVGFDMIIPEKAPAELIVLEINPRLTTGFLAWQELRRSQSTTDLPAALLSGLLFPRERMKLECDRAVRFRLDHDWKN